MLRGKNHFELGEKRLLWQQIILNDEIFQKTSLRVISRRKKETENIFEKIEVKKKELLQNQAEHEELLAELSKQNGDTQKIATLVLREIKNDFLKNTTHENNKSGNSFRDENITRSTIKNLWKNLQKNLNVIQCKNLAEEVLQMLQVIQRDKNISGVNIENSTMSISLQEITQLFLEESNSAQLEKAEEDWKRQKKELNKILAIPGFENKKMKKGDSLKSFLKSLDELSPEDRWKIAEKILKTKNISPNNSKELADYIASVDKDFARKINLEKLFNFDKEKNIGESKNSWRSTVANFFKSKLFWLLLLFLALVVGFLIFENFVKVENL